VRYVIDFYNAAPTPEAPAALHLDVRPALDSPMALLERLSMQWRWVSSGRWRRE
jgi:cytochrome c heme-lyase